MLRLAAAVERAMKRQKVILRALSGALSWLQATDILGIHSRSLRGWRARHEADQVTGLYDRRQLPSPGKAPVAEVQRILRLYRDTFTETGPVLAPPLVAAAGPASGHGPRLHECEPDEALRHSSDCESASRTRATTCTPRRRRSFTSHDPTIPVAPVTNTRRPAQNAAEERTEVTARFYQS